ncbi:acyl-CoA-binding protein [Microdochium trichocladiopsis]|uniref:Acyl-CoA-binding protein n=1 Tax=Microdochium trichocladiopsis TaxID=1682393 RepID=A0A9P9BNH9_9PEZI|nr:acyl-CoA-binding protein [Microdochium trichocladiopsis]KAH7031276.1 acyl-CoA-binding protein [Microdochium trichocladiopsis]
MSLSPEFQKAVVDSKKLTSKPESFDLLELYALYKIANGEDFSAAPKPGMFDLKNKAKYSAWEKKVQSGISAEDAQKAYVEKVEALKASCGFDASKEPEAVGA